MTRADLAAAASFELAAREKHWPTQVAAGAMTQVEADADIAAWRHLTEIFTVGVLVLDPEESIGMVWPRLTEAVQRAIDSRTAKPPSEANDARLAALGQIRASLIASAHAAGAFAWNHEPRMDAVPQDCRVAIRGAA